MWQNVARKSERQAFRPFIFNWFWTEKKKRGEAKVYAKIDYGQPFNNDIRVELFRTAIRKSTFVLYKFLLIR